MKKNIAFIILAILILGGGAYLLKRSAPATENNINQTQNQNMSGLTSEDLVVGTGAEAKAGDTVTVHYTGTLDNGTKFDSSVDRGQPFSFLLGAGQVIPGWDQGVAGMKVGGKRRLTIPSELAYGVAGVTDPRTGTVIIPSNATLHFDIELLDVKAGQ